MEVSQAYSKSQIVLLHDKIQKRREDRYIVQLAAALQKSGHIVTLLTSHYNPEESTELAKFLDDVSIKYSGWWIPRSIFGLFRPTMTFLKTLCMSVRMLANYPKPKPFLVFIDNSTILCMLKMFSNYRIFYVEHFAELKQSDALYLNPVLITPSLFFAKCIKRVEEIIVDSPYLAEIFKETYPVIQKDPKTMCSCIDMGLWNEPNIHIERIIPDLLENHVIFLTVAKYQKSSNLNLAIDAFELLLNIAREQHLEEEMHLIIAGHVKTPEENQYYRDLVNQIHQKPCASRVTFLRQLPTIHLKTLLTESTITIHPAITDLYTDFVLASMCLGKPILATHSGVASRMLEHKVSAVLIEASPTKFACAMQKLIVSASLRMFLGEMAQKIFMLQYSSECFTTRIVNLVKKYAPCEEILIPLKEKKSE